MSTVTAMHDPIKVYDARWEASDFSDREVTRLFEATFGYGRELGVDTVVFTRDARLAAGHVMELGVQTALRLGLAVYVRPEPISTPQGYFTTLWVTRERPSTMGLAITASHNPAAYIGVKFTVPPVQSIGLDCGPRGGLTRVREIYHSDAEFPDQSGGRLVLLDLSREFLDYSMAQAGVAEGDLAGLRLVLDGFNGSAGPEVYNALVRAGAQVWVNRLIPDGTFPTGSPNPTSQGKMGPAIELARRHDAHLVIGIDGDGDRMVFGDQRGVLTAGFVFTAVLRAAGLADPQGGERPGGQQPLPVLYDPKVSPLALAEWGRLGVQPVLFRNGHSQIKDYMTQIGAPAAAEESGHYYHRLSMGDLTVSTENSTLTILLLVRALKGNPRLMDDLWEQQNRIFTTGEFNYQFADNQVRDQAMAAVIDHFVRQGASKVTHTPDGIDLEGTVLSQGVDLRPGHVHLDEGWYSGYLRVATNEKGVVRSYFSAGDTARGKEIEAQTREILEKQFAGQVID